MTFRGRIAGSIATAAVLGAGLLATAAPVTAAPAAGVASASTVSAASAPVSARGLNCGSPRLLTGSAGHKGASVSCTGGSFTASVVCDKQGYRYTHFGNRAVSGGTSTVWCDLGAAVVQVMVEPT
ncbi:hypothetical protein ABTX35_05110 [Streptomyces sp. NPDC096080]|uniref:hypothetical protein n=1 Tax=Streptomyces sp. NPDC096080 TaxID=3156693 RepID=UPI00332CCCD7